MIVPRRLLELARVTVSKNHTHFNHERHQRPHTPDAQWHEGTMAECPNPDCTLIREIGAAQPVAADTHRCSGCGHRWTGLTAVELCGDCWRTAQPILHSPNPSPQGA